MPAPPAHLADFAAARGLELVGPCTGGHVSTVWSARRGAHQVVLKTDVCPPDAPPWRRALSDLHPEAAWLTRHRSAPEVLECTGEVLVLEHVPHPTLEAVWPPFDPATEAAWITAAVDASGPPASSPHLLDPVGTAVGRLVDRGDLGTGTDRLLAWLDWARDQPADATVAFDVLPQNTLAGRSRWYAIDPWPVRGPLASVGCSWVLARAVRDDHRGSFRVHPGHLARSRALLEHLPDPSATAWWMPAACAWWMFWPGQRRHRAYGAVRAQLVHWVGAHRGL